VAAVEAAERTLDAEQKINRLPTLRKGSPNHARAGRLQPGQVRARHAGMDRSYFGAIERGEFNVSLNTMLKIARALDTTGSALLAKAGL
jgi:transcriptional regulator with XRE-family HTH domain